MGSDKPRAMFGFEIELRLRMQSSEDGFRAELRKIAGELGPANRQRLRPYLVELLAEFDLLDAPGMLVACSQCGARFKVAVLSLVDVRDASWRCPTCAHG